MNMTTTSISTTLMTPAQLFAHSRGLTCKYTAAQIRDAAILEAMKRPLFGCDGEGFADYYNGKDYFEVGVRVSCATKKVIRTVYRRNHWRVSRREFDHYVAN